MSNAWDGPEENEWASGDEPWTEQWSAELSLGDPERWRGDVHGSDESWRGGEDAVEWPSWDTGPEYRMWKKLAEDDES